MTYSEIINGMINIMLTKEEFEVLETLLFEDFMNYEDFVSIDDLSEDMDTGSMNPLKTWFYDSDSVSAFQSIQEKLKVERERNKLEKKWNKGG